jgi:peptide-methionine (S)-S-oxide reductase
VKSLLSLLFLAACTATVLAADTKPMKDQAASDKPAATQRITFGGGCFWCLEAVFQRLKGVKSVASGYAGGDVPNPSYKMVCTGETGHAEVVQLEFDPAQVSYETLMHVFWAAHDPTTLNRQGNDHGTQYRSIILYENEKQKAEAEKSKAEAQKDFKDPIVTQIVPLKTFYKAEDYHQDYFNSTGDRNPYCSVVIRPKLQKLLSKGLIREEPYIK